MTMRTTDHLMVEDPVKGLIPTEEGRRVTEKLKAVLPEWDVYSYHLRIGMVHSTSGRTMSLTMEVVDLLVELHDRRQNESR